MKIQSYNCFSIVTTRPVRADDVTLNAFFYTNYISSSKQSIYLKFVCNRNSKKLAIQFIAVKSSMAISVTSFIMNYEQMHVTHIHTYINIWLFASISNSMHLHCSSTSSANQLWCNSSNHFSFVDNSQMYCTMIIEFVNSYKITTTTTTECLNRHRCILLGVCASVYENFFSAGCCCCRMRWVWLPT